MVCFLATGASSFSISFSFSAKNSVPSDKISFLRVDFISSKFSVWTFGDLFVHATGFMFWLFRQRGVSESPETNSSTAFLFWLLVVILEREKKGSLEISKFFQKKFFLTERFRNSKKLVENLHES